jgi:uncharacterized membrane protein YkvI
MTQPLLSAAAMIAAADLTQEIVEVPEWGGNVLLVQLSAVETAMFTRAMHIVEDNEGMYVMVMFCARNEDKSFAFDFFGVNEQGKTIIDVEKFRAIIEQLKSKSMPVLTRLQRVAMRLNGLSAEAKAALKKD